MRRRDDSTRVLELGLILVVSLAVGLWVPLAHVDWFSSHEHTSYVARTVEWAVELRGGKIYPRWCPDFYGGYGSPLFVFHAPVVYAAAGLLTATFLDPFASLKVVVLFFSVLSGVGAYALVYGETRQRHAALVGAVAYLSSPYRIGDLYVRGDLCEFASLAVLPVVIALYRAGGREARPRRARSLFVGAAVAHALLIMTHPILGLWGSAVIGVIVLVTAFGLIRRGASRRALMLVFAMACAPGLAAIYVVPAMAYRAATHTASMVVGLFKAQDRWIPLHALFDASNVMFPKNILRIGPIVALAGALTVCALVVRFRRGRSAAVWMALTVGLVTLTLPVASGFWAPGRVPLSQFIQFPWRLLGPASLTAGVALGIATGAVCEPFTEETRRSLALAASAAMVLGIAWPYLSANPVPKDWIMADPESIRAATSSATEANEFLPIGVPSPPAEPREKLVAAAYGAMVDSSYTDGSTNLLAVRAERPGASVDLALYGFPGWTIHTLSGPANATLGIGEAGLERIDLPLSGSYRLRVSFGASPASRAGTMLSVFSALGLCSILAPRSRTFRQRMATFFRGGRRA